MVGVGVGVVWFPREIELSILERHESCGFDMKHYMVQQNILIVYAVNTKMNETRNITKELETNIVGKGWKAVIHSRVTACSLPSGSIT
jgi:hypothetical protein